MTNEMKLLTAFIEASGFDIKEVTEDVTVLSPFVNIPKTIVVDYKVTKRVVFSGFYMDEELNTHEKDT